LANLRQQQQQKGAVGDLSRVELMLLMPIVSISTSRRGAACVHADVPLN
jgi:hypothetical protein